MENKIKFAIQLYRQSHDLSAICRKKHEKFFRDEQNCRSQYDKRNLRNNSDSEMTAKAAQLGFG